MTILASPRKHQPLTYSSPNHEWGYATLMRRTTVSLFILFWIMFSHLSWAAGSTWTQISGIYGRTPSVLALVIDGTGNLYAGTQLDGVFMSKDGGSTWTAFNDGLTKPNIRSLASDKNGNLYAGTIGGGVFRFGSSDGTWVAINNGLADQTITAFIADSSGTVYAGTTSGTVFKRGSGANAWTAVNTGLKLDNTAVDTLAVDSRDNLYTIDYFNGVLKLGKGASFWTSLPIKGGYIISLVIDNNDNLYAASNISGVYKSSDGGNTWAVTQYSPYGWPLAVDNKGNLYSFYIYNYKLALSRFNADGNTTFTFDTPGLSSEHINFLTTDRNGNLYAGSADGLFKLGSRSLTWAAINTGMQLNNPAVYALHVDRNGKLYAGTDGGGVFKRSDGAWRDTVLSNKTVYALASDSQANLYAGLYQDGLYRLGNDGTWKSMRDFSSYFGNVTTYALAIDSSDKLYLSDDSGRVIKFNTAQSTSTAEIVDTKLIDSLAIDRKDNLYLGTANGEVLQSSSDGKSLTTLDAGLGKAPVYTLLMDRNGNTYAGTLGSGVFKLSNGSGAWNALNSGLSNPYVNTLALDSSGNLYAGTYGSGVFKLGNGSGAWTALDSSGLANQTIWSLAIDNSGQLYAGTNSGLFQLNTLAASLTPAGPLSHQSLIVNLTPVSGDLGQNGCIEIAAVLPQNLGVYMLGPKGWTAFSNSNPAFYSTAPLAATQATVIKDADLSNLIGTQIYVGYGRGSTATTCLADMLKTSSLKLVYTIQ